MTSRITKLCRLASITIALLLSGIVHSNDSDTKEFTLNGTEWEKVALQHELDPYLDVTGLWIGGWQLFAPEPDKVNSYLSAEVRFADGKAAFIRSPQGFSPTFAQFFNFTPDDRTDSDSISHFINKN